MKKFIFSMICTLLPILASAQNSYWENLRSTLDHGVDVLIQARGSENVDQWMIEELEMFLQQGNDMYNEQTASEDEVTAMIEDLTWRIQEVEEMMKGGSDAEPYAVLSENNTVLTFYYDNEKDARGGMDVGPFPSSPRRGWQNYVSNIISVVFDATFANCTSVTSTRYWFQAFTNLTSITGLENLNTSNVTDMTLMFNGCRNLTSLDVSHFNTDNVTEMRYMFGDCRNLTSLDVSHFNTRNVQDMTNMFDGCSGLTNLDLRNFDTSSVTEMSHMFEDCTSLISLDVSSFNTSKVSFFNNIFAGCTSLTSLDITNFDTSNATYMAALFKECSSLTSLDLSNFNTTNVTNMETMFGGCTNLTTVYVSNLWSVSNVSASSRMFQNCGSLVGGSGTTYDANNINATYAHIDGGESNPGYLTGINGGSETSEEAWAELHDAVDRGDRLLTEAREAGTVEDWALEELENMTVKGSLMYEEHKAGEEEVRHMTEELNHIIWEVEEMMKGGSDAEPYAVLSENNTVLTFYYDNEKDARGGMDVGPFTDGYESGWYEQRENIERVVFDESFASCTTIESTAYWFDECKNLTTIIDLSNLNTENVTDMEYMFYDCSGLTSLDVSGFNTENVTDMGNMFYGCSALTKLDVSEFNTSKVDNMAWMFANCSGLTSLDLNSFNTAKVEGFRGMFNNCSALETISAGEGWSTAAVVNGEEMFDGCTNLVGGRGTQFNPDHTDVNYAHIDGGVDNPGYLTGRGEAEAYFDGLTAWVSGDATLNDAFADVGRETAVQTIAAIVWESSKELTPDQLQGITNPNLLVYVNDASIVPDSMQNIIVNGTAEKIILSDATGNNNFYCPQSFTAKSISYSRDFSQTTEIEVCRGWETIALPFDVQSITHESQGALIPFGGEDSGYHFWLRQLSDNGLTRATQIEANKPYLISMPNNTVYPSVYNLNGTVTFSSTNVTVPETSAQSASYANVTLYAAFQKLEQSSSVYALNVGEARGEYPEGSVFEQNYRDIRPFQAYTTHTAGTRGFITLESLGGNDNTTGIEEIRMNSELRDSNGPWYSLDGRRLDAEPTKKGIYVKDGRKFVIK